MTTSSRLAWVSGSVRIDSGGSSAPLNSSSQSVGTMSLSAFSSRIHPASYSSSGEQAHDQFLVRVRSGTSDSRVQEIAHRSGLLYLRASGDVFHVLKGSGVSLFEADDRLKPFREVVSVEWNAPVVPLAAVSPNDPYFTNQWALEHVRASLAWEAMQDEFGVNLQTRKVTVAIIDSGIDFNHEDLNDPSLWVDGWDFAVAGGGAAYGYGSGSGKADQHGTMVASIVGALTDNKQGVAGLAWGTVQLMPIRVFATGVETTETMIAEAVNWALARGVDVINLSLGNDKCTGQTTCDQPNSALSDALKRAWEAGVPVIAAAGNTSGAVLSPANHETTIAVGASVSNRKIAGYSSRGMDLNVVAPGGGTYSCTLTSNPGVIGTKSGGDYHCMPGTSFATPHVTGIVALMLARGIVSGPADVMRTLEITAQRTSHTFDDEMGWGLVDAYGAVTGGVPSVFMGAKEGSTLRKAAPSVKASGAGGAYQLGGVPEGTWALFAWVDVNRDGSVNTGDYFGESAPFAVAKGKSYTGLNVTLTRYHDAPLSVTQ